MDDEQLMPPGKEVRVAGQILVAIGLLIVFCGQGSLIGVIFLGVGTLIWIVDLLISGRDT